MARPTFRLCLLPIPDLAAPGMGSMNKVAKSVAWGTPQKQRSAPELLERSEAGGLGGTPMKRQGASSYHRPISTFPTARPRPFLRRGASGPAA